MADRGFRVKLLRTPFAAGVIGLLAACGSSNAHDKSLSDTIRAVKHAPRIPADVSEGQKAAGAEIVLQEVPDAQRTLKSAWFVGPAWLPGSGADLHVKLNSIRHGLCLMRAGELQVDADDFCGLGSYMPNEGNWLAVGIANLDENTSRDFLSDQLVQAEQYAKRVQQGPKLAHQ